MYIYKTTNCINGKFYVGMSKYNSNDNPEYIGSGCILKKAIDKYGKDNFTKEILEECKSISHMKERERFWIKELKAQERNIGYNISEGGDWGDTWSHHPDKNRLIAERRERMKGTKNPNYGHRWSDTQRKKASKQAKQDKRHIDKKTGLNKFQLPESRKKISETKMGIKNPHATIWQLISPNNKTYWILGGIKRELKNLDLGLDYQQFRDYRTEKVQHKKVRHNKKGWILIKHGRDFDIPNNKSD